MFKQILGFGKKEEVYSKEENHEGGIQKLKSAVALTGRSLVNKIVALGREDESRLTDEALDEIEETLIRADVGVDLAIELTEKIRANVDVHKREQLKPFLKEEFYKILALTKEPENLSYEEGKLNIYLIVGVNGAGKTTLIGKLASRFINSGKRTMIAAADTFRAAAEDQLEIWAERSGAQLVRKEKADAAAVVFESLQQAKSQHTDVLIIDTAGRLQNKFNLMEELSKIKRIIEREAPSGYIYESLLVIDATTGQNALRQAEVFQEAVQLTGVALTKLDGSARGGIVFNIARHHNLPVKLVGVGEKIDDLRDFKPNEFIEALFEEG